MAVTVTALELATALRAADGVTALTEPLAGQVNRLLGSVVVLVEVYAPDAPEAVQNEAAIRLAAWLFDAVPGRTTADALGQSGARSILAPFRVRRALAL